jgi:antibiotic biosynthesis monooxygenase (ABM) superfamily enzyme
MISIDSENKLATLIVVFSVDPSRQEDLLKGVMHNLETVVKPYPGFVSSTIHKSLDGMRIVNYIQWESPEAYQAYLEQYPAKSFPMGLLTAPPDARLYSVEYQAVVSG